MTKQTYWALFYFYTTGEEIWNSIEDYPQNGDKYFKKEWKKRNMWQSNKKGEEAWYVYVEVEE